MNQLIYLVRTPPDTRTQQPSLLATFYLFHVAGHFQGPLFVLLLLRQYVYILKIIILRKFGLNVQLITFQKFEFKQFQILP